MSTGTATATVTFTTISSSTSSKINLYSYIYLRILSFLIALGRCTSTSCLNGGTCYNTGNDYICVCPPQYTGPSCSQQMVVTTASSTTSLSKLYSRDII